MKKPRDYQESALNALFNYLFTRKGNPLVVAPVSAGKSLIMAEIVRRLHEMYPHTKIINLAHNKELIQQNIDELYGQMPFADAGIYCAGLKQKRLHNDIVFASIQSIANKVNYIPRAPEIIIVDESHLISHKEDTQYRQFIKECQELNPNMRVIGVTGTPFRTDTGRLDKGENALFDDIAYEIEMGYMIEEGWWAKPVSPKTDFEYDTSSVPMRGQDFDEDILQDVVNTNENNIRAVDELIRHGKDRNRWLIFTAGVQHAEEVTQELIKRGIDAKCVHSNKSQSENDKNLKDHKAGKFKCLVNVAKLCLDAETEILTDQGFVGIDDMTYDHNIAAWKEDGGIEYAPPKDIVRRKRFAGERMVSFSENGISANIRVTSNHRMVVRCGENDKNIKVLGAEKLVNKACRIPAFGECEPDIIQVETPKNKQCRKTQIRTISFNLRRRGYDAETAKDMAVKQVDERLSLKYSSPHELTLDECKLIGFWLGDGSLSCGRCVISQSFRYKDNIEWFDNILKSTGICHSKSIRKKRGNLCFDVAIWSLARGTGGYGQKIDKGYFHLEPYLKKDGTHLFRYFSKDQILALLEGFWKADGLHHAIRKLNSITGTQYDLYNVLQSVCVTRGISASISREYKTENPKHSSKWKFSWGGRVNWSYTNKSIKEDNYWKDERIWCVTSSTSYLICRRKGKVFVTGNTTGYNDPNIDLIGLLRPLRSPVLYVQIIGRGVRVIYADGYDIETKEGRLAAIAASIKPNVLVVDFGGAVQALGPIDQISIKKLYEGEKEKDGDGQSITKTCPQCGTECSASQRYCYNCSYCFINLDGIAGSHAVVSMDIEPEWVSVMDVYYEKHNKKGSVPSMKVSYATLVGFIREWVCFEHNTYDVKDPKRYAFTKAIEWKKTRLPDADIPRSIDDACGMPWPKPARILVKKKGKYFEILDYDWGNVESSINEEEFFDIPF